jgi:hypothetical protein
MSTIEVRKVEPAALSPKGVCEYLSLSKRSVSPMQVFGEVVHEFEAELFKSVG